MVTVAKGVHANRIIKGKAIVNPVGDPALSVEEEKRLRINLVKKALKALQSERED